MSSRSVIFLPFSPLFFISSRLDTHLASFSSELNPALSASFIPLSILLRNGEGGIFGGGGGRRAAGARRKMGWRGIRLKAGLDEERRDRVRGRVGRRAEREEGRGRAREGRENWRRWRFEKLEERRSQVPLPSAARDFHRTVSRKCNFLR